MEQKIFQFTFGAALTTMKSICFALVSLTVLCPLVAYAKPTVEPSLENYLELRQKSLLLETCAETLRDDLRPLAEDFGGWIGEVFNRVVRIIELRQSCDSIEMSDPPTRWELIQREACEIRFQGAIVVEFVRLNYEISHMLQTYPSKVRESIEKYLVCTSNEIPDFHEFQQMISSMNRD